MLFIVLRADIKVVPTLLPALPVFFDVSACSDDNMKERYIQRSKKNRASSAGYTVPAVVSNMFLNGRRTAEII